MCDSQYEYEPKGIFGTGQASPLQHVKARAVRSLGFLAAKERAMPPRQKTMATAKTKRIAAAKTKRAGKSRKEK